MIPRNVVGKGISGAVRYVMGEGKGPSNDNLAPGEESRVAWIGGQNFGFAIDSHERVDLARRIMEFDALNQTSRTRRCEKDAVHLMLAWRVGVEPTKQEMEEAAHGALKALGMEGAKAIWVAHRDEDHAHLHIVASKINPDTGRAYDLKGDHFKLSKWAEKYEEEHGGVVCLRRQEANGLRDAIDARDASATLEAMTRQRATFAAKDLNRELGKLIKAEPDREKFRDEILSHGNLVRLSDKLDGPVTRYTTHSVLADEQKVLHAASALENNNRHAVGTRICDQVLSSPVFSTIRDEQRRAFYRAVGEEGLSLIDGQAGTGKSYTMAAIRTAYEAEGYRAIGLAPTNAVASDMGKDGFSRSGTVHSELFALKNGRTVWDARTVVMVDEAAMLDTKLVAELTGAAKDVGAKLILVGDDRQLASIDRGGMFGALKDQYGAAALSEVARQHKDEDKRAASMMAEGNFSGALEIFDAKGSIHWTEIESDARAQLVEQWVKDSAASPDKSRFVFAYTNDDVKQLNAAIREVRKEKGELGEDHMVPTSEGWQRFAANDRIQFTGTNKKEGLYNGAAGTVMAIEGSKITVKLDGKRDEMKEFDATEFQTIRHGYAGTIYRGQGRTLDQTYLFHSHHWRSAASYVGLTRHREKAEIFVATETLQGPAEPWMKEKGGASALSPQQHESAERSYDKWRENNPQASFGFDSYVGYVQKKWAENQAGVDTDTATNLQILARQMARVDERRAASQFYTQEPLRFEGGESFGAQMGDTPLSDDRVEQEMPQLDADMPVAFTDDVTAADSGSGGSSKTQAEDDMAKFYREIAEAAKEREDAARAHQRERGRSR